MNTRHQKPNTRKFMPALATISALMLASSLAWSDSWTDSVSNAAETAGEVITDSAVTAQVKTKLLAKRSISGLDIEVSTDDGVVTLAGEADSQAEKDLAACIASNSAGVSRVKNDISVD